MKGYGCDRWLAELDVESCVVFGGHAMFPFALGPAFGQVGLFD